MKALFNNLAVAAVLGIGYGIGIAIVFGVGKMLNEKRKEAKS